MFRLQLLELSSEILKYAIVYQCDAFLTVPVNTNTL